jgi:hypothetical protein
MSAEHVVMLYSGVQQAFELLPSDSELALRQNVVRNSTVLNFVQKTIIIISTALWAV